METLRNFTNRVINGFGMGLGMSAAFSMHRWAFPQNTELIAPKRTYMNRDPIREIKEYTVND